MLQNMANPRKVNENGEVFIELNGGDHVISLEENPDNIYKAGSMCKVSDLVTFIKCRLLDLPVSEWNNDRYEGRKKSVEEGLTSEFLELGSLTWKKGKLKVSVRLEFYPDEIENTEPESPLDEIRKTLNS
jgi:hypothetical protein